MERLIESVINEGKLAVLSCAHQAPIDLSGAAPKIQSGNTLFCKQCEALDFPSDVNPYMNSKVFDQDTVPKGLKSAHSTKEKTWGKIVIESGELDYVVDHLDDKRFHLSPGVVGIIAPKMTHHLEISQPVQFHLEFFAKGK